jgi:hypothetical protein
VGWRYNGRRSHCPSPTGRSLHPLHGRPALFFAEIEETGSPLAVVFIKSSALRSRLSFKTSLAEETKMKECACCGKSETNLFGGFCGRCESIRDDEVDVDQ